MSEIQIGTKRIGPNQQVFIIAEAGVNHNGSFEFAKQLVDTAVAAGADAVKFQIFTTENLVTSTAAQAEYQSKNTGKTESQFAMLKRLELSAQDHRTLQAYCHTKKIIFLSTPFSETDADFLESLAITAYKIPSGEINNIPYLTHIAKKNKPMIVSTGMANLEEVITAVETIYQADNKEIIVLHSTSNYPPSLADLNLRAIPTLQKALAQWNILVGYSDNGTPGVWADVAAVALGACVVEKHFTLDKNLDGPDHKASLNPTELKELVTAIRETETMLGDGVKRCMPGEEPIKKVARKSIVTKHRLPVGHRIELTDLIMKRPGNRIPPTDLAKVIGKKIIRAIPADTLLSASDYES